MRLKKILVTGLALTTLLGCGMNNESVSDRGLNNVENVKNQPTRREGNASQRQQGRDDYFQDGPNYTQDSRGETNRTGPYGRGDVSDRGGMIEGRNTDQRDNSDRDMLEDGYVGDRRDDDGNYQVADDISDRVTSEVNEVKRAYVLTMGDSAYVACQLDNANKDQRSNDLSDKVEREVKSAVQDADSKIENVYVSSNPDFIDLTSNYMRDIDSGKPVEGFIDQFTEMIGRIFPTQNR